MDRLLAAAKAPIESVRMNRDLVRDHVFSLADLENILKRTVRHVSLFPRLQLTFHQDLTPSNRTELLARQSAALSHPPSFAPFFAPCAAVHPWSDRCGTVPAERFAYVFRWSAPLYGALHFIPLLLFKRKVFLREPGRMLVRAGVGTLRSATFFGMCVVIFQCECP